MGESKRIEFNGQIYERTGKGKYYFCILPGAKRKGAQQLHRAVWEFYSGEKIPKGYHIHHKDFDVDNNDFSNLECMEGKKHLSLHAKKNFEGKGYRDKLISSLDKARSKASLWHGSPAGIEWHRAHAQESIAKAWAFRETRKCAYCGKEYEARHSKQLYCSQKCGNRKRTGFGIGYKRTCAECGAIFTSKLQKAKYCSSRCKGAYRYRRSKSARLQSDCC